MYRYVLGAVGLSLALVAGAGVWLRGAWTDVLPLPENGYVVHVEPGTSLSRVARDLHEAGVLPRPFLFKVVGRFTGADGRIRQGEYHLPAGSSAADLLTLVQSRKTIRYLVTLPEGIRLADALAILREADGIEGSLTGPDDARLQELLDDAPSSEGYFLAETYQYERGVTDLEILRQAHRMAADALEAAWEDRDPSLPYARPYEALIMASIIEKETAVPEERPIIAGVFVRRLKRGMRLQTDPTVIYGLGPDFDGNLTRAHLRDESNAYNTYRHGGLPPTPISLPGKAAIEAALNPRAGESLYFVARGDGSHEFSATLAEHEAAVRRYQLQRRSDYRSTPEAAR